MLLSRCRKDDAASRSLVCAERSVVWCRAIFASERSSGEFAHCVRNSVVAEFGGPDCEFDPVADLELGHESVEVVFDG